jgi:hypothetical protein
VANPYVVGGDTKPRQSSHNPATVDLKGDTEMANDEKTYKSQEDPERAFYLISACHVMRDFPKTTSLAAAFIRELNAMNLRQEERDVKDREQVTKEAAAQAAKEQPAKETAEDPRHAPTVARRT